MIRRRDIGGDSAWPDVAGDVLTYSLALSVVAARIRPDALPEAIWSQSVPERLMFCRSAMAAGGQVAIVGKGNGTGAPYFVRAGLCTRLAASANGNFPIAIVAVGDDFLVRWTEPNGWIATRWPDGSITRDRIPAPWTGTALGLLDLEPDGTPIYTDAGRLLLIGPWLFQFPNRRTGNTVGLVEGGRGIYLAVGEDVFCPLEAPDGIGFGPHLSVGQNGRILVCAFTSRGASVAIIDPPYPEAERPPVSVPVVGRRVDVGWFRFGTPAIEPPANCSLVVDADMLVRRPDGRVIAQYVNGVPEGDIDALDRAIASAKARRPGVPVLAYWTAGPQRQRIPIGADIIGVEAYAPASGSLADFEARVRASVSVCPRAALIAQCYSSNAGNTRDLVGLVPIYARILRDCRNVTGIFPFSAGPGRATGWDQHPEVHEAWRALVAGITGPSTDPEESEFMEPWKVKFLSPAWAPGEVVPLARGVRFQTRVALGNGVEFVFEKDAKDEIHVAVFKDGQQQDRSGLARHVAVKG